jgi:hypothetical protein
MLPADYDGVEYQSISRTGSTRVTVHPGQPAYTHSMVGVCWSCMFGEHDWLVWPVCPHEAAPEPVQEPAQSSSPSTSAKPGEKPKRRPRVRWLGGEPVLNDPLPANVNANVNAPTPGGTPPESATRNATSSDSGMMPVPMATEPTLLTYPRSMVRLGVRSSQFWCRSRCTTNISRVGGGHDPASFLAPKARHRPIFRETPRG